jgi:four helix bundle protein
MLDDLTGGTMDARTTGNSTMQAVPTGPATGLRVVDSAVDVVRDIADSIRGVRGRHGDLVNQLMRASESVALNLAEGAGRAGRDKAYHYGVAYASAGEAVTALRLLAAYRVLDPLSASNLQGRLDQIRAMTWRLIHPA